MSTKSVAYIMQHVTLLESWHVRGLEETLRVYREAAGAFAWLSEWSAACRGDSTPVSLLTDPRAPEGFREDVKELTTTGEKFVRKSAVAEALK